MPAQSRRSSSQQQQQPGGGRSIPIANAHRPSANNRQLPGNRTGLVQSSLDLVFSYSRAQTFFGSNIKSSPSFVARYRGPGFEVDDDELISSDRERDTLASEDNLASEERTTEESSEFGDDADDDASNDDVPAPVGPSWVDDNLVAQAGGPWSSEQLPRNAVSAGAARSERSSRRRQPGPSHATMGTLAESPARATPPLLPGSPPPAASSADEWSDGPAPDATDAAMADKQLDRHSAHSPPPATENTRLLSRPSTAAGSGGVTPTYGTQQGERAPEGKPKKWQRKITASAQRLKTPFRQRGSSLPPELRVKSTWMQACFNAISILCGVGLLAEPLAFAQAGWVLGILLLLFSALATNYTAKLLSKIQQRDPSVNTYAEVLIQAFGPRARWAIHTLFFIELGTLSIALVNLFADSLNVLFPQWTPQAFKMLAFVIVTPTTLVPLRYLSVTSLIGVLSSVVIVAILLFDGCYKKEAPGSLHEPVLTHAGPHWSVLPSSFGILMSGYSAHAVFPSLYRDMRNPEHFPSMVNWSYFIVTLMYLLAGIFGYLMFGGDVRDEVTINLLNTPGYPQILNKIVMWMVAINPLVKYGICSRPLSTTIEIFLGWDTNDNAAEEAYEQASGISAVFDGSAIVSDHSSSSGDDEGEGHPRIPSKAPTTRVQRWTRPLIPPALTAIVVVLATVIPSFARVLALLGSFSAYTVCIILPCSAYLLTGRRKGTKPRTISIVDIIACSVLVVLSVVLGSLGTVWAFI